MLLLFSWELPHYFKQQNIVCLHSSTALRFKVAVCCLRTPGQGDWTTTTPEGTIDLNCWLLLELSLNSLIETELKPLFGVPLFLFLNLFFLSCPYQYCFLFCFSVYNHKKWSKEKIFHGKSWNKAHNIHTCHSHFKLTLYSFCKWEVGFILPLIW